MVEQTEWTAPRELRRSFPREVEWTGNGVTVVVVAALLCLGGFAAGTALSRVAAQQAREAAEFEQQGQDTLAVITRLWSTGGKNESRRVAYQFHLNDREYTGWSPISRSLWSSLRTGDSLPVRFLPSDPARNHAVARRFAPMPAWLAYFIMGFLFCQAGLMLYLLRRDSRLLESGRPAQALIATRLQNKVVKYEFRLPSGAVVKGRTGPRRDDPQIGDVICILYDPENPRRNARYPLSLVRVSQ